MFHEALSKLLTSILSAVTTGLQSYCDTSYSRGGVNHMWNLKNSKDLLDYIHTARSLSSCNSINTFDCFTFYTTIPHSKLKDRLTQLVQPCFIKMNGQLRYKYLVLRRDKSYFVIIKKNTDSTEIFSESNTIKMFEFWIDNIFVIPMDTNCASLLADLFLYWYEFHFIHCILGFSRKTQRSYPVP